MVQSKKGDKVFAVLVVDCCLLALGGFILLLCSNSSTILFFAPLFFKVGLGGWFSPKKEEKIHIYN